MFCSMLLFKWTKFMPSVYIVRSRVCKNRSVNCVKIESKYTPWVLINALQQYRLAFPHVQILHVPFSLSSTCSCREEQACKTTQHCHEAWLVKVQLPRGTFPSKAFAQRRLFSLTLGRLGTGYLQHFGCKRKYLCTCTNWLPWESGMCCTCLCHFVSCTLAGDLQLQAWATMPQIKMQACYILLLLSTPAHINIIPAHRRHVAQSQP
jgi:hypothetical protein